VHRWQTTTNCASARSSPCNLPRAWKNSVSSAVRGSRCRITRTQTLISISRSKCASRNRAPPRRLRFSEYAPGCEEGIPRMDFGLGDAFYKQRFGTEGWEEASVFIFAPTLRGLVFNVLRTSTVGTAQLAHADPQRHEACGENQKDLARAPNNKITLTESRGPQIRRRTGTYKLERPSIPNGVHPPNSTS
jgi:hypothetical protein